MKTSPEERALIEEAQSQAPVPERPAPHGIPTMPLMGLEGLSPAALRAAADAAEAKERAEADARRAAQDEHQRKQRAYDDIYAEAEVGLSEVLEEFRKVMPGCEAWAARVEKIKGDAAAKGQAVDGQEGAAEVRDRLHTHPVERRMPFFNLLRDDNPPGDRL